MKNENNKKEKPSNSEKEPNEPEVIYEVPTKQKNTTQTSKVTFKSLHRGTLIFIEPEKYIRFVNHIFQTDDEELIEFLRNHPAFGQEIFEGEFPDWVKEKFKKDKQFINYFNPEDETIIG